MDEDESPCIGVCRIGKDGRCEGCGRTEAEIHGQPPSPDEVGSSAPDC